LLAAAAMPFFAPLRQHGPALHLGQWWDGERGTRVLCRACRKQSGTQASWLSLHGNAPGRVGLCRHRPVESCGGSDGIDPLLAAFCRNARNVTRLGHGAHDIRTSEAGGESLLFGLHHSSSRRLARMARGQNATPSSPTKPRMVRRGDFFLQFDGPLLSRHLLVQSAGLVADRAGLEELAETACDEAAIQTVADRASYAAILVEVSLRGRTEALTAMAHKAGLLAASITFCRTSRCTMP